MCTCQSVTSSTQKQTRRKTHIWPTVRKSIAQAVKLSKILIILIAQFQYPPLWWMMTVIFLIIRRLPRHQSRSYRMNINRLSVIQFLIVFSMQFWYKVGLSHLHLCVCMYMLINTHTSGQWMTFVNRNTCIREIIWITLFLQKSISECKYCCLTCCHNQKNNFIINI